MTLVKFEYTQLEMLANKILANYGVNIFIYSSLNLTNVDSCRKAVEKR